MCDDRLAYSFKERNRNKKIWISRNGPVDEQPKEKDRFTHEEAEGMADVILNALGLNF